MFFLCVCQISVVFLCDSSYKIGEQIQKFISNLNMKWNWGLVILLAFCCGGNLVTILNSLLGFELQLASC